MRFLSFCLAVVCVGFVCHAAEFDGAVIGMVNFESAAPLFEYMLESDLKPQFAEFDSDFFNQTVCGDCANVTLVGNHLNFHHFDSTFVSSVDTDSVVARINFDLLGTGNWTLQGNMSCCGDCGVVLNETGGFTVSQFCQMVIEGVIHPTSLSIELNFVSMECGDNEVIFDGYSNCSLQFLESDLQPELIDYAPLLLRRYLVQKLFEFQEEFNGHVLQLPPYLPLFDTFAINITLTEFTIDEQSGNLVVATNGRSFPLETPDYLVDTNSFTPTNHSVSFLIRLDALQSFSDFFFSDSQFSRTYQTTSYALPFFMTGASNFEGTFVQFDLQPPVWFFANNTVSFSSGITMIVGNGDETDHTVVSKVEMYVSANFSIAVETSQISLELFDLQASTTFQVAGYTLPTGWLDSLLSVVVRNVVLPMLNSNLNEFLTFNLTSNYQFSDVMFTVTDTHLHFGVTVMPRFWN